MDNPTAENMQSILLTAMQDFVRDFGDETILRLAEPLLNHSLDRIEIPEKPHPAASCLSEIQALLTPAAHLLFQKLVAASPTLAWQNSYTTNDGFGQEYLEKSAWCDVVGPEGIYLSNEYRIGFAYWRKGLFYPPHSHEPEEVYWVLGGTGLFTKGDAPARQKGPGSIVHHEPYTWHSIDMRKSSVLVFFFWRGRNLHIKSKF